MLYKLKNNWIIIQPRQIIKREVCLMLIVPNPIPVDFSRTFKTLFSRFALVIYCLDHWCMSLNALHAGKTKI